MTDDELVEQLRAAVDDPDRPGLRRVLREATGEIATPSGFDYLQAVRATDGDVALELDVVSDSRTVVRGGRHVPADADGNYQLAGDRYEPRVATVERAGVHGLLATFPVRPVLHSDVADLFDAATEIETADPTTHL